MNINIVRTEGDRNFNSYSQEVVTCKNEGCSDLTTMTGTQLCDGCWEERYKDDGEVHVIDCCPKPLYQNTFTSSPVSDDSDIDNEYLWLTDEYNGLSIVDTSVYDKSTPVLTISKKYKVTLTIEEVDE